MLGGVSPSLVSAFEIANAISLRLGGTVRSVIRISSEFRYKDEELLQETWGKKYPVMGKHALRDRTTFSTVTLVKCM